MDEDLGARAEESKELWTKKAGSRVSTCIQQAFPFIISQY